MKTVKDKIEELETDIGTNTESIESLTSTVEQNSDAIDDNSMAIDEILEKLSYEETDITVLSFRKNFALSPTGLYATSHPEAIAGYSNDDTPYVYAGTTFTVNPGYKLSVSVWPQPITGNTSPSSVLQRELNVENGTITVNQDGYLGISIANADGTSIPSETTEEDFATSAIESCHIYLKTVKDKIEDLSTAVEDASEKAVALKKELLYKDTDITKLSFRKGYAVNSYGWYAISHPEAIAGYSNDNTPYVYAGTKFTVRSGYKLSVSVWPQPITGSMDVSTRLQRELNVENGTITVNQDGYLGISIANADGTSIPSETTEEDFATSAISSCELYIRTVKEQIKAVEDSLFTYVSPKGVTYKIGNVHNNGNVINYKNAVVSSMTPCKKGDYISADSGFMIKAIVYSKPMYGTTYKKEHYAWTSNQIDINTNGFVTVLISDSTNYNNTSYVLTDTSYKDHLHIYIKQDSLDAVQALDDRIERTRTIGTGTQLYNALKDIAEDWHFPFIDTYNKLWLGANHYIPGTVNTWPSESGTSKTQDLVQKDVWMKDGTHPYLGPNGLVETFARTIAKQLNMVSPFYTYNDGEAPASAECDWTGKTFLWMGTSIPAGSDPKAGSGKTPAYPFVVASLLGATTVNRARGSSCMRINASDGEYTNMLYDHFARSFTRTLDECEAMPSNWANIYGKLDGGNSVPSELTSNEVDLMKSHSYETLLVPYLDGTNAMPDLFVIDHGHNDTRPRGIDGTVDLWIKPTYDNIRNGLLAEDTYMTANNYANLKAALNNNLSGIPDITEFAATLNRNCLQGAMNFIITVILTYNPYAHIVIVSDYN